MLAVAGYGKTQIRIGCQTRSYGMPPETMEELLPRIKDMAAAGYTGFETNMSILKSLPDLAAAKATIGKYVPLVGLHLGVQLHVAEAREKNRAILERTAKAAHELGGTHIVLSRSASRDLRGEALREGLRRKCEELVHAAEVCRKWNIRVGVHNHEDEAKDDFAELRAVMEGTPAGAVWLVLDVGHATAVGAKVPPFIKQYSSRITAFHIQDCVGKKQVPMGKGDVDLMGIAKAIHDTNWSGWAFVELEAEPIPGVSSGENVRHAKRYMEKEMKL